MSVHRLAERKGFRLDKVGEGQQRMPSGVPGHEYSFPLEQAEEWLASRDDDSKAK